MLSLTHKPTSYSLQVAPTLLVPTFDIITLAEVKTESKTKVKIKSLFTLASMNPQRTAIGIQAKMKNLYMSQTLGVNTKTLGIRSKRSKVPFKYPLPRLKKANFVKSKGIPKFRKKKTSGFRANSENHFELISNAKEAPPPRIKGKANTTGNKK